MARRRSHPDAEPPPREEQQIFADLAALCAAPGFVHAIALFCYRDNVVRFSEELTADVLAPLHSDRGLIRTEISTLIGLMVKQPVDHAVPGADAIQRYIDKTEALLHELHRAMQSVFWKDFTPEAAKAGFDPLGTGASLREPIFYGGDAAYSFQYRAFSERKYARDTQWLLAHKGFDIPTALRIADILRDIFIDQQKALPEMLMGKPFEQWTVLPAFCFSLAEVTRRCGIERAVVRRVIDAFGIGRDERNAQFTALQEYNVANSNPILLLGGDDFILLEHYSLLEAIYESPFYWMGADHSYAPTALNNRGFFAEELAQEHLKRVFGAHVRANIRVIRENGEELSEIDNLVVFGDRAIVLQAKAKRLTLAARKGNDLQIKDDFSKAIQEAYDQAVLCSKALLSGRSQLLDREGKEVVLTTALKEIFPVCIVADHYPALASQARYFLKAEAVEKIASPLVTDVFALDAITEMLESPLRVLSYLDLRSRYDAKIMVIHELTLLSTHLKHNLWIREKYDLVTFGEDLAVHVDAAMAVRREGLPGPRTPEGAHSRLQGTHFGRIISKIESRPEPATIDLGLQLLSLDEESANTINDGISFICAQTLQKGTNSDFSMAFAASSSGLTIHCNTYPGNLATEILFSDCELRKYSRKARKWFGLVVAPITQSVRFGIELEGDWKPDSQMDEKLKGMPSGLSHREAKRALTTKAKPGRNEPCPCGSGRKYKKCCIRR
jgi:hypothetical protein